MLLVSEWILVLRWTLEGYILRSGFEIFGHWVFLHKMNLLVDRSFLLCSIHRAQEDIDQGKLGTTLKNGYCNRAEWLDKNSLTQMRCWRRKRWIVIFMKPKICVEWWSCDNIHFIIFHDWDKFRIFTWITDDEAVRLVKR